MTKVLKLLVSVLVAVLAFGCTQCPDDLNGKRVGEPQFEEYAGVFRLYPAADLRCGDAPDGYDPFYISHYGRHGSRYVIDADQYEDVLNVLKTASADDKLTPLGQSV